MLALVDTARDVCSYPTAMLSHDEEDGVGLCEYLRSRPLIGCPDSQVPKT